METSFTSSQGGNQDIVYIDTDEVRSELNKVQFDTSFNAGTYSPLSLTSNYIADLFKKINDIRMEWEQDVTVAKNYCEKVESIPNPASPVGSDIKVPDNKDLVQSETETSPPKTEPTKDTTTSKETESTPSKNEQTQTKEKEETVTTLTGKTTGNVFVRTGPGKSNRDIGVIHKGEKIEVIEKMSNGWLKIKYKGKEAYISGKYAKVTETKTPSQSTVTQSGTTSQETVKPSTTNTPTTSTSNTTVTTTTGKATGNVFVRTGPGKSNRDIGVIHKGSSVEVIEKLSNGWVKVKYKGKEAYVSGKYLKV